MPHLCDTCHHAARKRDDSPTCPADLEIEWSAPKTMEGYGGKEWCDAGVEKCSGYRP